jgi:alpha-glucoside transport system permease protein
MTARTAQPGAGVRPKAAGRGDSRIPLIMRQGNVTPWLYLGPAVIVMLIFIIYPTINTLFLSFRNMDGTQWATQACVDGQPCWGLFENYRYSLTSEIMITSFLNNLKWIAIMVPGTVMGGLLIATLANQVRYESLAKSIIFLPMAISFVGAGVIWKFVYDYGTGNKQIGLLNAIVTTLGGQPVGWLTEPAVNNVALILVGIWMSTGFCMTILSAAIKNVPSDLIEAASVDGANSWITFWRITVPVILPTLTVVTTTMVINVLKIFDIVYIMTGGNYGTEVIANRMYQEQYSAGNSGRAAAIAVVLIVIILPAMYFNIRRFQAEEATR